MFERFHGFLNFRLAGLKIGSESLMLRKFLSIFLELKKCKFLYAFLVQNLFMHGEGLRMWLS